MVFYLFVKLEVWIFLYAIIEVWNESTVQKQVESKFKLSQNYCTELK